MKRLAPWAVACVVPTACLLLAHVTWADDVTDNAIVAHKRLVQLQSVVQIYMNDSEGYVDDPLLLLDAADLAPEDFWHPGDTDPLPTDITNSMPNAPDSTQVSFLFHTGYVDGLALDDALIWDASPLNNNGQFISFVTVDGGVETIPPTELPYPTNVKIAQTHLARIARALFHFQYEHGGLLPDELAELYPSYFIASPRTFWNPGDSDPLPTDITNSIPNALNSAHISFDFPGAGLSVDDLAPDAVVLQDNSAANNAGLGINIVRNRMIKSLQAGLEFVTTNDRGDANGDTRIDLADWAKLQRCYRPWGYLDFVEDDSCRIVDFDDDGRVGRPDHELFIDAMTGPGQR